MNNQLNPQHAEHLRRDPMVSAWIAEYQKDEWRRHPDCTHCGWPHTSVCGCGMGSTFGCVRLGGQMVYVDTSNVHYLRGFMDGLGALGFHWRNEVFIKRT